MSAIESLNTLMLSEQDYQSKIEAVKVKTDQLCAQMNELHMRQTKEFEEDIRCVEKDLELLASESEKCVSEFCGNMKSLGELNSEKNKILLHLNATIEKHKAESERNACQLNLLAEEKKERTKRVNELNDKASQLTKEIEIRQERHQENSLSVEKDEMKLKEVNDLIAGLEVSYNTLQSEHTKFVHDSETDKQVYMKGLQDFQNTSNLRLDEVKALQKQINVWKDKINKEKASHKGDDACSDLKVDAESSRVEMTEVEKSVQEWGAKVFASEAEASKAETEAGITRRILEQLKSKIAAHRAEKNKRQVKVQEPIFKVPTPVCITQKVVTPQFSATVSSDTELTPRSILKASSKSPTPQQRKSVTFIDFDDGSSSSSSIMLEPEMIDRIAANPAAKSIIEAQHRERQEAKRKLV
ncbi:hypothetical protein ONE63_004733 [Megalurothrips usitatus]|uniref:Uncharacterized protein n=1 Tax=Megalurothrips usitatus TaxID=439358 RepID=A0AAV7X730_9NEOP|nr:hypothetical protein ONE63_004733 [Megalurothrips usitatus]